ncbi:PEP/pyruvate-binding domain-containing protein [Acidipropionibacterium virtanenii]|uniref:Phosphoenolpyruvate synthase n=1 Tax=Acidipropionibacterium virtanenii TaxID=2057246 RepID=A0A344URY6_9ACTN|nr:PEP/pyruvate-binding domain-containing protein [Acidipropionibacterium virtanenii]AXE38034.1 Phosphoenolpyruvate synthase [Acidipropionibacterium virtanenii]
MNLLWFRDISRNDIATVGGKGANLGELSTAGLPVPPGFVLTTEAYRQAVAEAGIVGELTSLADAVDPEDPSGAQETARRITGLFAGVAVPAPIRSDLLAAWTELGNPPVAVRSSATTEDLADASFAGQQETYLHVRGEQAVLDAVRDCWASLFTARALAYRAERGIPAEDLALAVVIQEMVAADAAGVMFTSNPATGRREETLVSAAWGLGEAVVSGMVDTDDLVVDTAASAVLSRTTADKAVMVVPDPDNGTRRRPVPAELRRAPVLTDARALDLAAWGARIADHYGAPQDVEWALAGTGFVITQARPIVSLPEPAGPTPTTWPVPRGHAAYFRASIVEQMPDPLSPLFADLARAHVLPAMDETLTDVSGRPGFARGKGMGFPTINGYAYYQYSDRDMAALMGKAALMIPRAVTRGLGGPTYWRTTALPRYQGVVAQESARDPEALGARELLDSAERLVHAGFAYYTAVQTVIPPVATAESSLTAFCKRVRRPGDPDAASLLFGYDSAPIRAEQSLYDLGARAREDASLARALLACGRFPKERPAEVAPETWTRFEGRLAEHLRRHGHATYTLDLMRPVAADTPDLLWEVFAMYLRGEGTDPAARRERAARARDAGAARIRGHLARPLRAAFDRLLGWAQRLAPVREDALAGIGLGWPAARRALRALGARLVGAGALAETDQVFWLRRDELAELAASLDAGVGALPTRAAVVEERRRIWRGQALAQPPQMLPDRSIWHVFDPFMPAAEGADAAVLHGIGGSGGTVTAPVRVLTDPSEFSTFRPGEILVAAITTPAWTPLFAMAAGVVTDVGGPLSHSSIVAREYGIPAVLGTGSATRALRTGETVTIDGTSGTVRRAEHPES